MIWGLVIQESLLQNIHLYINEYWNLKTSFLALAPNLPSPSERNWLLYT